MYTERSMNRDLSHVEGSHLCPTKGLPIMLRFLVDRLHVNTPDSEVEANIRERCVLAREKGADIEPEREEEWVIEAIRIHRENRRIHDLVVWAITD